MAGRHRPVPDVALAENQPFNFAVQRRSVAPKLHVTFELLNSSPNAAYNEFYAREWIDMTSPVARARLAEAAETAREAGLRTFYSGRELSAALAEAA